MRDPALNNHLGTQIDSKAFVFNVVALLISARERKGEGFRWEALGSQEWGSKTATWLHLGEEMP